MFKATFVGTVFNKQCYLGRTIYTIEQQEGFENIQVVYANDGSTDRTGEILNHFKDKYKDIPDKFVVVDMPENVGISKALNEAHKYAKSDIIIICSEMMRICLTEPSVTSSFSKPTKMSMYAMVHL
jgi:Glycosyltransferases involved in cell wall biogenesis